MAFKPLNSILNGVLPQPHVAAAFQCERTCIMQGKSEMCTAVSKPKWLRSLSYRSLAPPHPPPPAPTPFRLSSKVAGCCHFTFSSFYPRPPLRVFETLKVERLEGPCQACSPDFVVHEVIWGFHTWQSFCGTPGILRVSGNTFWLQHVSSRINIFPPLPHMLIPS